ncbi:hypothetical protein [Paenibacillus lautus]|uniref:hypothetical protein n=1 Tax=Paenibacillus lautus TaxID=1401 RepID=UPI0013E34DF3|nr:hypothetical protein [Paenibacillus lautus]
MDRCSFVKPSLQQTQSSVEENDDFSVIIEDQATGASFESAFHNMWNDGQAFKAYGSSTPHYRMLVKMP